MEKLSNNIFDYFIVALFTVVSGGVLFYIEYGELFVPIFFLFSLLYFVKDNPKIYYFNKIDRRKNYNLFFILTVMIYFIFNSLINMKNQIHFNEIIIFVLFLFGSYFTISSMTLKKFVKIFLNIMAVLCVLSIIIWGLGYLGVLPYQKKEINDTVYCLFLYHNLGWDYVQNRNSSIFWEPGIYQIFLNVSIALILFTKNKYNGKDLILLGLFLLGVITTKSTTGYLVTLVILFVKLLSYIKKYKNNAIIYLAILVIMVIGVVVVINTPTIANKFSLDNYSFGVRIRQNLMSLELMKNKLFFGYGINSLTLQELMLNDYGLKSNSNGLFVYVLYFGIPMLLIYIVKFLKNRNFKSNIKLMFIIWLMINMTEYFLIFPLAYIFIFDFKDEMVENNNFGGEVSVLFR